MFSSETDQWATPQQFYDELNQEFNFDLDPCADEYNHKCDKYFNKDQDGLLQNWGGGVQFSAIPLMGDKLVSGLRRHTMNQRNQILLWSC